MVFSERQADKVQEIINIGIGKSAAVLNQLVKSRVSLSVPKIKICSIEELKQHKFSHQSERFSSVSMKFDGEVEGKAEILFPIDSAVKIVDILSHNNNFGSEMNTFRKNALSEVGNIVLNSLVGTFANLLGIRFKYKIPQYLEQTNEELHEEELSKNLQIILAETKFIVKENEIEGSFLLFFEIDSFENFTNKIDTFSF